MKLLFLTCLCIISAQCSSLRMPEYLQAFSCRKSDPAYEKCVLEGFSNAREFFVKGIPELGISPLDPLKITSFSVNRTLNQLVSLNAVCTNVEITGLRNTVIRSLKADPINHYGEIRLVVPWAYMEMDYDIKGQLLVIPLENKGHFQGNFTDTQMVLKGSLKTYMQDGVEYFKVGKLTQKITIGSGEVKLTSKDKDFQYAADLITDFFNENPRRVLDAVNPIFIDFSDSFMRKEFDKVLAKLPASEWLPE